MTYWPHTIRTAEQVVQTLTMTIKMYFTDAKMYMETVFRDSSRRHKNDVWSNSRYNTKQSLWNMLSAVEFKTTLLFGCTLTLCSDP